MTLLSASRLDGLSLRLAKVCLRLPMTLPARRAGSGSACLDPLFPLLRAFPEGGVGGHPQVADHMQEVEPKRHVLPALKALAHQTPQAQAPSSNTARGRCRAGSRRARRL